MNSANLGAEAEIRALYRRIIDGWNERNADAMAEPFFDDGELIGFDGSRVSGKICMISHLQPIFAEHPTPPYLGKIKEVRMLGSDAAVLRAIAGMIPSGKSGLDPKLNTHHTLIAEKRGDTWRTVLFQNTPAQFHGRPDLVEDMTQELKQLLS